MSSAMISGALDTLDTAGAVLDYARTRRADADRAEADLLQAAVAWAGMHSTESIDSIHSRVSSGSLSGSWGSPTARGIEGSIRKAYIIGAMREEDLRKVLLVKAVEDHRTLRRCLGGASRARPHGGR